MNVNCQPGEGFDVQTALRAAEENGHPQPRCRLHEYLPARRRDEYPCERENSAGHNANRTATAPEFPLLISTSTLASAE